MLQERQGERRVNNKNVIRFLRVYIPFSIWRGFFVSHRLHRYTQIEIKEPRITQIHTNEKYLKPFCVNLCNLWLPMYLFVAKLRKYSSTPSG